MEHTDQIDRTEEPLIPRPAGGNLQLPVPQPPQHDGNNVGDAPQAEDGGQNNAEVFIVPVPPVVQLPVLPEDVGQNAGAFIGPVLPVLQLQGVMCPELYRSASSGDADVVLDLLNSAQGNHGNQLPCVRNEVTAAGGNTVLHIAAGQGHDGVVTTLFQGALEQARVALLAGVNNRAETALHLAARAGHQDMVARLIGLIPQNTVPQVLLQANNRGDTVLHEAARHGHHAVVVRLMPLIMDFAPALLAVDNQAGESPLYLAVISRSVDIVRALIPGNAVATASGPNQQNALHAAVLQSAEISQAILEWNLNLAYGIDGLGSTPLHYAVSDGDSEIIRLLIGFVPSALYLQDQQGFTPLHIAAWMGHVEIIHDILQACPDVAEVTDMNGRNFLHVAIERGHESVVKYVVGSPFAGGLVNEQDINGNTPLHSAVISGKPQLAILESEYIELNIANNAGRTPFDLVSDVNSFLPMISFVLKLSAREAWIGTQRQDRILVWRRNAVKEWVEKLSKNLGIVAVLIATIALTAMANVPGGYDSNGVPNLGGTRHYKTFLTLDTSAVACSMIATMLLIYGRGASRSSTAWICLALFFLWWALMGMLLAFMAAVIPGLDHSPIVKRVVWSIFALPFGSMVALSFVWAVPAPTVTSVRLLFRALTAEDRVRMRRHSGRRFPLVGFYLLVLYLFWFLNVLAFGVTVHVIMTTV